MKPESLLLGSQDFSTSPWPQPDESDICILVIFSKIRFNIIFPSKDASSSWYFKLIFLIMEK
jgi:hypothetical protein